MATTMRNMQRILMAIHNLGTVKSYGIGKRFIQTSTSFHCDYSKDSLIAARPHLITQPAVQESDNDAWQAALKRSRDQSKIFSIVNTYQKKLTLQNTMHALNSLYEIQKSNQNKICVREHPEFLILCENVKTHITQLQLSNAVELLKILCYFEVPSTSIIVQMVLQIIRQTPNQLTCQQISFLLFLLTKCDKTPLVEALQVALPIIYENNIITQLNRDDMQHLTFVLRSLSEISKDPYVISVVLHALRNCKQKMTSSQAYSIASSLYNLQCYPDGFDRCLKNALDAVTKDMASVSRHRKLRLLDSMAGKMKIRQSYYHEGFVDACASACISEAWEFDDTMYLIKKLSTMSHTHIPVLDYIGAKCFEDPAHLKTSLPEIIANLVTAFAQADYKPVFWDVIQESIMDERILEASITMIAYIARDLTALDCYCPKLVDKVFEHYAQRNSFTRRATVLLLYQAMATLYPQYPGPFPISRIFETPKKHLKTKIEDFPLLPSLECALGGSRYVQSNVKSKLAHHIDHVLVLRKGGFPIAINNREGDLIEELPLEVVIEEVKPPQDAQVILVLYLPSYAYSVNSQRMKATYQLQIKSLEALTGFTVIPIQSTMWQSLSNNEKIPYLMQAIRLKCEDMSISANS